MISNKLDDSIKAYRKSIKLKSTFAKAHCELGAALGLKGQVDDQILRREEGTRAGSSD